MKTMESNKAEQMAVNAAAERIAKVNERNAMAQFEALAAKVETRKMDEAVKHLAATKGACFIAAEAIAEMRIFSATPGAFFDRMIETGRLGYNEEICHVTLAMG